MFYLFLLFSYSLYLVWAGPIQAIYSTQLDTQVMGYYPLWVADQFPPEQINFSLYRWIDFAFAIPDIDASLLWDDQDKAYDILHRLVVAAHSTQFPTKIKLSIGGWGGSKYFSPLVASSQSRQTFVRSIVDVYDRFNLDGIDIDWEYPAQPGPGNVHSPDDTSNFLAFLLLLRASLPSTACITAAAQTVPFLGPDGYPITDVAPFAAVLDWVLFMNYDTWGLTRTPGPNAPFYDRCHNSTLPGANAVSAYNAWSAAGLPSSKMVLGLPSYGYLYSTTATHLRTRRQAQLPDTAAMATFTSPTISPSAQSTQASETIGSVNVILVDPDGSGQIQFRDLVHQGVLLRGNSSTNSDGSATLPGFYPSGGFTRYWDDCSSTPYLRSEAARQLVAYDDPQSLAFKALFAKQMGMRGINLFHVHGDTSDADLIRAVTKVFAPS